MRVMWRWALLGAVLAAGGCGRQEFLVTFDACEPLTLVAPDDASELELASIRKGIEKWRAVFDVDTQLIEAQHVSTEQMDEGEGASSAGTAAPRIPIRFVPTALYLGRYDDKRVEILLTTRLSDEPDVLAIVFAHELGHAYGLYHVGSKERPSVMNRGNIDVPPTPEDAAMLEETWGACSSAEDEEASASSQS